ncbi:MAG: RNA methyltransferase [Candidatus Eremiobacteraeota bacterium]|nr:RNA methyltransferase [Candidatus Eremiobacteraeota bacterium]MCW5870184.1 RNA methyltransferase [Candidatus Eremiobacteraeota bacterium]
MRKEAPLQRIYVLSDGAGLGRDFFELAREQAIPVVRSQKMRLDSMTGRANHQGVVASLGERSFAAWQEVLEAVAVSPRKMLLLALDGVQDPGNFGALLRTAEGAGAQGVVVAAAGSCPLSATVSKASAGADAFLKVARSDRLDRVLGGLAEEKIQVVATLPDGDLNYWEVDWKRPSVLVLGSEGSGISDSVLRRCTHKVRLPMLGQVQSLNVAASAAAVLYEAVRQRS